MGDDVSRTRVHRTWQTARTDPLAVRDTKAFDPGNFARFVDLIPDNQDGMPLRHALEPRHDSIRDPAVYDPARARNMAIVFADDDEFPCIDEPTADFAYARLLYLVEKLKNGYPPTALDQWADNAHGWAEGGWGVFVYFISGAKVRNPAAAQALTKRLK